MKTSSNSFRISLMLAFAALVGCEEQKEQALEYFNKNSVENVDSSNLEKFGFDDKPTAVPTGKNVIVPFDDKRTRSDARSGN